MGLRAGTGWGLLWILLGTVLAECCLLSPVIEVASGEYGDLNPVLFRAVQNGLCTMAEKKGSPEKTAVPGPSPSPPDPPVSQRAEGRGQSLGEILGLGQTFYHLWWC